MPAPTIPEASAAQTPAPPTTPTPPPTTLSAPVAAAAAPQIRLRDEAWYAWHTHPAVRAASIAIAIAAIAAVAWAVFGSTGGAGSSTVQQGAGPVIVSQADLVGLSGDLQHPVYWAGARPGTTLEATLGSNGRTFVRYLPAGAAVGSAPTALTVGTYLDSNAFANLRRHARSVGADTIRTAGGGLAFTVPRSPTSAYLAYRGQPVQIEVADPTPGRALSLITSGAITPAR